MSVLEEKKPGNNVCRVCLADVLPVLFATSAGGADTPAHGALALSNPTLRRGTGTI